MGGFLRISRESHVKKKRILHLIRTKIKKKIFFIYKNYFYIHCEKVSQLLDSGGLGAAFGGWLTNISLLRHPTSVITPTSMCPALGIPCGRNIFPK